MDMPQDTRLPLCLQLQAYMEKHPERQAVAQRILRFVLRTPDCFERSHAAGHITGSAWLLNERGDKALLTLHRKLKLWVQPGGHADGDPDVLQVALREACEESGIEGIKPLSPHIFDVDIHTIPARPASSEPEHLHYDIRYLLQAPHGHCRISEESDALLWCTAQDLQQLTPPVDEAVMRLASLWRKSSLTS